MKIACDYVTVDHRLFEIQVFLTEICQLIVWCNAQFQNINYWINIRYATQGWKTVHEVILQWGEINYSFTELRFDSFGLGIYLKERNYNCISVFMGEPPAPFCLIRLSVPFLGVDYIGENYYLYLYILQRMMKWRWKNC